MMPWSNLSGKAQITITAKLIINGFSPADTLVSDAPADYSASVSSCPARSPATTTLTPSFSAATPTDAIATAFEDGTIYCEHCRSQFKLGKNGRRGQASNLQKHKRNHHPETIPNYRRVLHECRWGCGAKDPNRSNIRVHEKQHCSKKKGKQLRRNGKWHRGDVAFVTNLDGLAGVGLSESVS